MGGTEKNIMEISKELSCKGHKITVLSAQLPKTKRTEILDKIKIVRVPSKIFYNLPHPFPPPYPVMHNFLEEYETLLKKEKFDIVHIHNRFCFGKKIVQMAKRYKAKTILTIHNSRTLNIDFFTDFFGQAYDDFFGKNIMKECDGIIAVSKNALDTTIPENYNGKKRVIYNGCNYEKLKKTKVKNWANFFKNKGFEGKMVLANARLVKQKGLEYLIDAMKQVKEGYLVIFGRGPLEKELKKRAAKNKIRVYFLNEKISEEDLASLYRFAHIFVLSSLYEPFGMVIIEAYASKIPVIATRSGGPEEIVINEKTGFLVSPRDSPGLAEKINFLMANKKKWRELSKNAYAYSKKFRWNSIAKQTERFYREILKI
jgi:glycosyltransferase involved in cell wall biosynthesis